jgi:hypothetical protein
MNDPKVITTFRSQPRRDFPDGDHLERNDSLPDTAADGIPRLRRDATTMRYRDSQSEAAQEREPRMGSCDAASESDRFAR